MPHFLPGNESLSYNWDIFRIVLLHALIFVIIYLLPLRIATISRLLRASITSLFSAQMKLRYQKTLGEKDTQSNRYRTHWLQTSILALLIRDSLWLYLSSVFFSTPERRQNRDECSHRECICPIIVLMTFFLDTSRAIRKIPWNRLLSKLFKLCFI